MTYPSREDADARFAAEMRDIVDKLRQPLTEEPHKITPWLSVWLAIVAEILLVGILVGLLAWWIWR